MSKLLSTQTCYFYLHSSAFWHKSFKSLNKITAKMTESNNNQGLEIATIGGGCFWCIEPIFADLKGVLKSESGYTGGHVENPTYEQICGKKTGHAEVIQITFDPSIISFQEILTIFFHVHDPTTLNRQGGDAGPQYRSAIFYHSDDQKLIAENIIAEIEKNKLWNNKVVTEITKFAHYYVAEGYHQQYFKLNGHQPYCAYVIAPKMVKFRKEFKDKLRISPI
jgi:peptide-methionine (S)-S-oxide reductase